MKEFFKYVLKGIMYLFIGILIVLLLYSLTIGCQWLLSFNWIKIVVATIGVVILLAYLGYIVEN